MRRINPENRLELKLSHLRASCLDICQYNLSPIYKYFNSGTQCKRKLNVNHYLATSKLWQHKKMRAIANCYPGTTWYEQSEDGTTWHGNGFWALSEMGYPSRERPFQPVFFNLETNASTVANASFIPTLQLLIDASADIHLSLYSLNPKRYEHLNYLLPPLYYDG